MQTYHFDERCSTLGNSSNTYTTDSPTTGDTECTSQADTVGSSCSHRTLRVCVLVRGSVSCSTNRLASSHPTSHRPETSLVGVVADGCPSLMLMRDNSRMGLVVHERASCSDLTRIRSSDKGDCEGDGPGGRGKDESVYRVFQSKSSYVMARNHLETCGGASYLYTWHGQANGETACRSPPDDISRFRDT